MVTDATPVTIALAPGYVLGEEVVVAASRVQERLLESPVSIERVGSSTIRNAPAANYYDIIGNLKGVDMTTSSITFKTISTRGFNGSGNLRFNQLVDGMDNQAPGLNFSVGNIIGLTELDVDNMELLPGASSALYGSGGMNGTLLINSKNPFKYQGFSAQVKQGVMHLGDPAQKATPYHDISIRWAHKFSDKWAFKIGAQYIKADDWRASDTRNLQRNNVLSQLKGGDRSSDPNYDGVNVFGDEASAGMQAFAQAVKAQFVAAGGTPVVTGVNTQVNAGLSPTAIYGSYPAAYQPYVPFLIPLAPNSPNNPYAGTFGAQLVSRDGYNESDLVDYNSYNVKLSGALHYKITPKVEASLAANWGTGTTVYTGADRYSLKNLQMGQYKLEVKGQNWFGRVYTIQENSGDSYTANTAAIAINRSWKSDATWFQTYTAAYAANALGITTGGTPTSSAVAHQNARLAANVGRILPGTAAFQHVLDSVTSISIKNGGAKFADKSALYHAEGQYNLTDAVKVVEVLVGASFRRYSLNSNGTIFADTTGAIGINEYGGYLQLQKQLLRNVLKVTGSLRYDKNENFQGRFTPRFTALVKVAEDNNLRFSYQTAYRFPSTQDQWINLKTPAATLIGGLPSFNKFYGFDNSPAYTATSIVDYRNSIAAGAPDPTKLKVGTFAPVKPESVQSFEAGYRGVIAKKLLIDVYGYYSRYKNFIARVAVGRGQSAIPANAYTELASPFTTTNYSFVYNVNEPVNAYGWGAGLVYQLYKGYNVSANVYSDDLTKVPEGVVTFFNTPKIRYNLGFGNDNVYKNIGFNAIYRWQQKVNWEGTFGTGEVPAYGVLDAQVSYRLTSIKSLIKLGATNITNKYYTSAFGNPQVGGLYYISFGYNVF
ncbi:TonB-dependent Receptor Plug Domain [Filimonas lacunae]|uniref:TonB-dependent Receptor Plug Domain n=1 Tax=Filimonas lacunae TaxID=477680 RepID=A0A173MKM8_9BACT|nr:TonB-dependent receptor [Filimonas lacunae]BAV08193.1 TonB-dependent receptor [Filimonas lacunae]SIT10616.1 TonB-dependent Receptor Plug Domain [Filimonas lacunae]